MVCATILVALPNSNPPLDSKKAVCPNTTKNGGVSINTSAGAAMTFEAYSMIASKKSVLVNKPVFNSPKAFTAPSVCLPFDGPGAGAAPSKGGKAKRYQGASAPGRKQYQMTLLYGKYGVK